MTVVGIKNINPMELNEPDKIDEILRERLPEEIEGYTRRFSFLNGSINNQFFNNVKTIVYSKNGKYLIPNAKINIEEFNNDVLFRVIGENFNDLIDEMELKIKLYSQITESCSNYLILDYKKIPNLKEKIFNTYFEVYLGIDEFNETLFFCIATTDIFRDINNIIYILHYLKRYIKKNELKLISSTKLEVDELKFSNLVQIFSSDFKRKKEDIKKTFLKSGIKVKFNDEYTFKKNLEKKRNTLRKDKIILCEGNNVNILNNLKLKNILFSDELNSNSIFQNIKTKKRYALRDKDYLSIEEKKRLEKKFSNYYILDYYSIENYLYHPDNLAELNHHLFYKELYIEDITRQKNENLDKIIAKIPKIRKGYKELSENHLKRINIEKNTLLIIDDLKSDVFDIFFKHFDFKRYYKKDILNEMNLSEKKLGNTKWFKDKIKNIIKYNR